MKYQKISECISLFLLLWILALIPFAIFAWTVLLQVIHAEATLYAGILCALIYCAIFLKLILREQTYILIAVQRKLLQRLDTNHAVPKELHAYMTMRSNNTFKLIVNTILLISILAAPQIAHNWLFETPQSDFMIRFHASCFWSIMIWSQFIFPILFINELELKEHIKILKECTQ